MMAHRAWHLSIGIINTIKERNKTNNAMKTTWLATWGFLQRKFPPHLANSVEIGIYLEASHYGPFGLKGVISLSTTLDGMPPKPNTWSSKSSLSMQKLCGKLPAMTWVGVPSMMMQSRIVIEFGELSTTKMTLTPCIGTLEHPTLAWSITYRVFTSHVMLWFRWVHLRELAILLLKGPQ